MPQPSSSALDAIPSELRDLDQWVVWRYQVVSGRRTKVPYNAQTARKASVTNRKTWSDFATACAAAGKFDGIGFVLSGDDEFVGIDMDGCIGVDGEIHEDADAIVKALDSYAEISPSERGIRIIARGRVSCDRKETSEVAWKGHAEDRTAEFAVYDTGRYLTFTGRSLNGAAVEHRQDAIDALVSRLLPDGGGGSVDYSDVLSEIEVGADRPTEAIEHLCAQDPKFAELWNVDPSSPDVDASQRDYHLAFQARLRDTPRANVAAILEHARSDDAHGRGTKRDRFKTYLARTIANAEAGVERVKRYRVGKDGSALKLPDLPRSDDVPGQCAWLTSVFNLDKERPITGAEWQGLRGPNGHVVLRRADAQQIRFEPATKINTPLKLIETLSWQRERSDGALYPFKNDHCRSIAEVIRLLCDTSNVLTEEQEAVGVVATFMQGAEPLYDYTTYGTTQQRYEAMIALRGTVGEGGKVLLHRDRRFYLVDAQTREIVIRVSDLMEAARRHTGGSLKHGWLDALMENLGWKRGTVQGYASFGRAARKEGHLRSSFYRGHLPEDVNT